MLKPALQLRLSQQLKMTPQLQQAIHLLQLPIIDLRVRIQQALEQNVMLEIDEPDAEAPGAGDAGGGNDASFERDATADAADGADGGLDFDAPSGAPDGADGGADLDAPAAGGWDDAQRAGPSETVRHGDSLPTFEHADRSHETLSDHLLWQLELENLDPRSTAIGQAIIDAVNDDGYVTDDLETIRATLAPDVVASPAEIESMLERVQTFDPAGVAARSVAECMLLQLDQLDREVPGLDLARTIAREHLELLAEQRYDALKRQLRVTGSELKDALLLVRACHPRPGAAVQAPAADYVVPDVFVRRVDGRWVVELNDSIAPRLRVNPVYAGSLGRSSDYDVLRTQLQEARWLIRSLEIRNETLARVALTIVERQSAFLEHGDEHMQPMVLRDVAEAIGMHESTISRVTANKYMLTPRGMFELRYFFSSHVGGSEGDRSSTAVRAKIRKLVAAENPEKPLSDSRIARMLAEDGVHVARRTVAKYRETLKIPSSSDRRQRRLAG